MCCNNNRPEHTCGDRSSNARCVFYDLQTPEYSKLSDNDCVTLKDTTEDLYNLVDWTKESVDLKDADLKGLDVEEVDDTYFKGSRILLKDVVLALISQVSELKNEETSDDSLELDFKCLTSPCGGAISNLRELLQALINEVCELKK